MSKVMWLNVAVVPSPEGDCACCSARIQLGADLEPVQRIDVANQHSGVEVTHKHGTHERAEPEVAPYRRDKPFGIRCSCGSGRVKEHVCPHRLSG